MWCCYVAWKSEASEGETTILDQTRLDWWATEQSLGFWGRMATIGLLISAPPRSLRLIRASADAPPGGPPPPPPAHQFARMAAAFRRRLLLGTTAASLLALGANFAGVTSFLLGISPTTCRALRLDVLYPVKGFARCLDLAHGFEFIYPSSWVGDQTLLYRQALKAESQRPLDPPPLLNRSTSPLPNPNVSQPVAAFGPPGSSGELNVSVIVSPVPLDFSIEAFGGPKEVGEAVLRRIAKSRKSTDVKAALIDATLREDPQTGVKYYKLEFGVEGSSFRRHNVAVCCVREGKLYTLNAQAPESAWVQVRRDFFQIADSFNLIST